MSPPRTLDIGALPRLRELEIRLSPTSLSSMSGSSRLAGGIGSGFSGIGVGAGGLGVGGLAGFIASRTRAQVRSTRDPGAQTPLKDLITFLSKASPSNVIEKLHLVIDASNSISIAIEDLVSEEWGWEEVDGCLAAGKVTSHSGETSSSWKEGSGWGELRYLSIQVVSSISRPSAPRALFKAALKNRFNRLVMGRRVELEVEVGGLAVE